MYVYCAYVCGAYVLHVGISPKQMVRRNFSKNGTIKNKNNKIKKKHNKLQILLVYNIYTFYTHTHTQEVRMALTHTHTYYVYK